jgi:ribosome-associated protein
VGYILSNRRPSIGNRSGTISDHARIAKEQRRDLRLAVDTLDEHKAFEIGVLDLRNLSDATDFFVIASGSSDTHVRALAEHVVGALERAGRRAHHVEGVVAGRWALLDFVDFVVHIFHPTIREFYQLERLWADAPAVTLSARVG